MDVTDKDNLVKEGFKCQTCHRAYKQKGHLRRHVLVDHKGARFRCHLCREHFKEKSFLKKHMSVQHNQHDSSVCKRCQAPKRVLVKSSIVKPQELFSSEESESDDSDSEQDTTDKASQMKCNLCNKRFGNYQSLKNHVLSIHDGIRYQCNVCKGMFARYSSVWTHFKTLHSDHDWTQCYPRKVDKNGKIIKTVKVRREKAANGSVPKCKFCDKKFYNSSKLKRHVNEVHEKLCHRCHVCQRGYSRKEHMKSHVAQMHPRHCFAQCKLCEQAFNQPVTRSSSTKLLLTCDICDSKFRSERDLQSHIRWDHLGKRLVCHLCSGLVSRKSAYRKHMIVKHQKHSWQDCMTCLNVKPVNPPITSKQKDAAFDEENEIPSAESDDDHDLNEASPMKARLKPDHHTFASHLCSCRLSHKHGFRIHMRKMHPNHKLKLCTACEKMTSQQNEKYACHLCTAIISRQDNYRKHMRVRHKFHAWKDCVKCLNAKPVDPTLSKPEVFSSEEEGEESSVDVDNDHNSTEKIESNLCHTDPDYDDNKTSEKKTNRIRMKCQACDKEFRDSYQLKMHRRSAHENLCYQCHVCKQRAYTRKHKLKQHVAHMHPNHNSSSCHDCAQSLTDQVKRSTMPAPKPKPVQCHLCPSGFQDKYVYKYHLRKIHPSHQYHECSDCQTLSAKQKFVCNECGKICSTKWVLRDHIVNAHTGQLRPEVFSEEESSSYSDNDCDLGEAIGSNVCHTDTDNDDNATGDPRIKSCFVSLSRIDVHFLKLDKDKIEPPVDKSLPVSSEEELFSSEEMEDPSNTDESDMVMFSSDDDADDEPIEEKDSQNYPDCGKVFDTESDLDQHLLGCEKRKMQCDLCDYETSDLEQMRRHSLKEHFC